MNMDLITVTQERGLAFRARVRGHEIRMDMPGHPRFTNAGPSPVELLVMAIGGCIGIHVALFCEQAGFPADGVRVDLSFTVSEENGRRRVSSVYAEVEAPGVPQAMQAAAEEAARASILPSSFVKVPQLDIVLRAAPGQSKAA